MPISSAMRRVPALWTMLTQAHRRVGVLGWWGSWPAEAVNGVVVSDRALLDLPSRVYPADYLPKLAGDIEWAHTLVPFFATGEEPELRDAVMAAAARRLVKERTDLVLLYFRSSDIVSHHRWKDFEAVEQGGPKHADSDVQRIYRAIDGALAEVLRAPPGGLNVLVISDHGFRAARANRGAHALEPRRPPGPPGLPAAELAGRGPRPIAAVRLFQPCTTCARSWCVAACKGGNPVAR